MNARRIRVALHAHAADLAGTSEAPVEVSASATAADVKRALAVLHPRLARLLPSSVLATDREYLSDRTPVAEERLHLIPPVSGG
jgi:molybdopterin converting factor small subunit